MYRFERIPILHALCEYSQTPSAAKLEKCQCQYPLFWTISSTLDKQECASERCLSPSLLSYEIVSTLSSWSYFLDQDIQHGILSLTIFQVAESLSQPIRAYALFTLIPLARIADTPERGSHSLYCPILFRQFNTFFIKKSPIGKSMFNWVKAGYSEEPMI